MAKPRIVLSGSYGTRNVGDDAILAVLIQQLSRYGFAVDVLTFTPEETARRHPHATMIPSRVAIGAVSTCAAIRNANGLVIGGGGVLQDATSLGNLLFHVSRSSIARLARTPVAIAGVGVGPLQHSLSRRLVHRAVAAATFVNVRDAQSAALLQEIGVASDHVRVGADFAHLLASHEIAQMDDASAALVATLRQTRESGRVLVGLSLRPAVGGHVRRSRLSAADQEHIESMARIADRIVTDHDAQIVFVSMHPEQDDPIARLLMKCMHQKDRVALVSGKLPPATIKAAVDELDLVVAMRLHALIFAASSLVPFVALAYDGKVSAYAESLGLGTQVLARDSWTEDLILPLVGDSLDGAAALRGQLADAVPAVAARAGQDIAEMCTALQGRC